MKNLDEFEHKAKQLVKYQIQSMNREGSSLIDVEKKILSFLYEVGSLLEEMVLKNLEEPVSGNRILIDGQPAVYKGNSMLNFKDRFGSVQKVSRRSMILEGDIFQVLDEMKIMLFTLKESDEALKEINFRNVYIS